MKVNDQSLVGKLQTLPILEWKKDHTTMDSVVGLPKTSSGYNAIWVVIDHLTKSAHFLPCRTTMSIDRLAELYVQEIVQLHGVHASIISDRDPRFTSRSCCRRLWVCL